MQFSKIKIVINVVFLKPKMTIRLKMIKQYLTAGKRTFVIAANTKMVKANAGSVMK